ncbi:hypothetical protein TI39_contig367g00015 [Zymoseptoria brevis]|uniref:Uncharacterized protein n=1 Tax=Zymoseptoria brevis TaxID=1047168 RepID=A0A0F4GPA1_9PEZI|nr:hypothetical protein TI39_contig367g00015 [Zymoseptoria brevis]
MHALEWGCEAAYVTILMMLAPNVRKFDMDWEYGSRHRFHGELMGQDCLCKTVSVLFRDLQAARVQAPITTIEAMGMQHLHTCDLHEIAPDDLARIMSIPSLRTVKADFFGRNPRTNVVPDFTAEPSGVTLLELSDSALEPRWMPPNLGPDPQTVNPEMIGAVLDGLQHSLRTLRIIDATDAGYVFYALQGAIDLDFFPPNLKKLTYHTYAWAHCIPDLICDLGELVDRGLDELIISCPTDKENRFRPDRILNMDYFKPVQELIGKPDRGEDLLIKHRHGFDSNSGRDRMDVQLRNLQTRTYPNVRETADMLWDHGLLGVLTYQAELPQVWEDETVYGEALTSMFEETDTGDDEGSVEEIEDVVASLSLGEGGEAGERATE